MKYVLIAVAGIIVFIACVIIVKKRQSEEKKYYDAADQMVKEAYLKEALQNTDALQAHQVVVPMLYLKLIRPKPAQGYVFNPEEKVTIGRDRTTNSIWIPYPTVSMKHCSIRYMDGGVYLFDENSMNGTIIKKGFRKYGLIDGEYVELESGDKIYIDEAVFKVTIFYFQAMKH